jgi:hypothetical protein
VPDHGRLLVQPFDRLLEMVGDLADRLLGKGVGVGIGLLDRLRVVGPAGVSAVYPASSKTAAQRSQLLGRSQSPWMKTTGVFPVAFAASICPASYSVIVAISCLPR